MNEICGRIHKLCSDFLSGEWSEIKSSDIEITPIEVGKSNRVFAVSLRKSVRKARSKPSKVLLRFYGNEFTGEGNRYKIMSEVAEAAVFCSLAERNLGPKLYGIFEGGRIEEFIESRNMTNEEILEPRTLQLLAAKIAQIHCMKMPVSKKQVDLLAAFKKNFEIMCANGVDISHFNEEQKNIYRLMSRANLKAEEDFILKLYTNTKQRFTFCHNDLNSTNFLIKCDKSEHAEKSIVIIDFEYCCWNFRGFDLGKFFGEQMIALNTREEETNCCATDEQIRLFVRSYLNELKLIDEEFDEEIDNEDNLMLEIEIGMLMIHICIAVWNFIQPQVKNETLHSFENGWLRYQLYKKLKTKFCQKYSALIKRLFL
ncbi:choline kinase alpha-like isoform X3 [Dinothrombium tinctorium]|uniref:Choline kinase alpha-like isoform X3 n=1 Tax=Dinothrombium tinctorium TaxID=1965070 RepID=A0A3S3RSS5_9ACAR|nr:choline kinase alpha-like isoform X3 [Dinothrombium tinctorium]